MALVDLDHVVEQTHTRHDQNADPNDHGLVGERQTIAQMRHGPPDESGTDDRQPSHRRSTRLLLVMLGAVVLLAEDGLTLSAFAEEADEEASSEERHQHRRRAGDHHGDHAPTPNASRTTSRSSKGRTRSPTVCVVSWPLPAMRTTSPGRARAMAFLIALRRSSSTSTNR